MNTKTAMRDLTWVSDCPGNIGHWKERHLAAVQTFRSNKAAPVVDGIRAWVNYAVAHETRYESKIGDDYVLGPGWAQWGVGLRVLLNGEMGDADCGTLDGIIHHNPIVQGFDPEKM
jgi:hypothetical protein